MATKDFKSVSTDHAGVIAGTKFQTIKLHHEVIGDLMEGTELTLEGIAHFPTRYRLKDNSGKLWTVPIHSLKKTDT